MLPSLLSVVQANVNHAQKDLRLFEIGKVYAADGEKTTLALIMTGRRRYDWRNNSKEAVDFYDLKGVCESIFCRLGLPVTFEALTSVVLEQSAGADLYLNGKNIGHIGQVCGDILNQWDIKVPAVYFAQINLEPIFILPALETKYHPVVAFPTIVRDVSISVKREVSYARIEQACLSCAGDLLKSVHLIEEYTGDKIPTGHRALVFSLTYQSDQRTLREEEVNVLHQSVIKALSEQCSATLR